MKPVASFLRMCRGWIRDRALVDRRIVVSDLLLGKTLQLLHARPDAELPHERVVYWAGSSSGSYTVVCSVIVPEAETTAGSFSIDPIANAAVVSAAVQRGWQIVAQVHSHPGQGVDHSDGDNQQAFLPYPGYLSVVVPHYAQVPASSVASWGFHVFLSSSFRRITAERLGKHIVVLSDGPTVIDLREAVSR